MVQQWSPGNTASCWSGMPLVPIQFASSYRCQATHATGKVAEAAEKKKSNKYGHLGPAHIFMPVAIETLGAFGPKNTGFHKGAGEENLESDQRREGLRLPAAASLRGRAEGKCSHCNGHLSVTLNFYSLFIYLSFISFIIIFCLVYSCFFNITCIKSDFLSN